MTSTKNQKILLGRNYFPAKGRNSNCGKFEMLNAKWNPKNGNTQNNSENEMGQCNPDTTDENPENVHSGIQASRRLRFDNHCSAKRPNGKRSKF